MKTHFTRARSIVAVGVAATVLAGCNDFLEVNIEGQVTEEHITSAAGADALRLAALGALQVLTGGHPPSLTTSTNGGTWLYTALLTDEFKATALNPPSNMELDIRIINNNNTDVTNSYRAIGDVRSTARDALAGLREFLPTPLLIAQMYFAQGIALNTLAEAFCNGTPVSNQVDGKIVYGAPLTNRQVYTLASAQYDTALLNLTGGDAATVELNTAVRILKARVLLNNDSSAQAAALVSGIPTSFIYAHTYSGGVNANGVYFGNNAPRTVPGGPPQGPMGGRMGVGDSLNPDGTIIANSVPFASTNDPRVPVFGSSLLNGSPLGLGNDGVTPFVVLMNLTATTSSHVATGLDARLIEAENELNKNTVAGRTAMRDILNALRASTITLNSTLTYSANALPQIGTVPATQTEAVTLFFREKAYWTYARGQRLGDLRRIIRNWGSPSSTVKQDLGFTQASVFPTGTHWRTGTPYGSAVNFPIPEAEKNNPNVVFRSATNDYCLDREA